MTNQLASIASTSLSMTSQEIAEYTGKRHDHVLRDIFTMFNQLKESGLPNSGDTPCIEENYISTYTNKQNGQSYSMYCLPKDLTLTLVSGYSAPMRHAIVKRWLELESKVAPVPVALTYRELMLQMVDSVEKLEAARVQIAMDAPKVHLHDTVVGDKAQTISEMIRKIEPRANQQKVRQDLIRLGYLYVKAGRTCVYAKYLGTMFKEGSVSTNGDRAIFALADGKIEMTLLAEAGKFTMKK